MTTQQTGSGTIPVPPPIPGGGEVYDRIMAGIEPDLVTAVLPTLEEKYANETQEQRDQRMERYKKAFLKYEEEYQKFILDQGSRLRGYKRGLMSFVEERAGGSDSDKLNDIESLITNLAV